MDTVTQYKAGPIFWTIDRAICRAICRANINKVDERSSYYIGVVWGLSKEEVEKRVDYILAGYSSKCEFDFIDGVLQFPPSQIDYYIPVTDRLYNPYYLGLYAKYRKIVGRNEKSRC